MGVVKKVELKRSEKKTKKKRFETFFQIVTMKFFILTSICLASTWAGSIYPPYPYSKNNVGAPSGTRNTQQNQYRNPILNPYHEQFGTSYSFYSSPKSSYAYAHNKASKHPLNPT